MSIASELILLGQDKTAIANAITEKGGSVNEGDGFHTFATDIATIPSGSNEAFKSFADGSLTEITSDMLDGATTIIDYAFRGLSSLITAQLPSGITSIGHYCFYHCSSLTSISLPSGITSIGQSAFNECSSLQSLTFPEGVEILQWALCNGCTSLQTVSLPSTVISISLSFSGCTSLRSVIVNTTSPPALSANTFADAASGFTVYVPAGSVANYQGATNWSVYNIQAIPS